MLLTRHHLRFKGAPFSICVCAAKHVCLSSPCVALRLEIHTNAAFLRGHLCHYPLLSRLRWLLPYLSGCLLHVFALSFRLLDQVVFFSWIILCWVSTSFVVSFFLALLLADFHASCDECAWSFDCLPALRGNLLCFSVMAFLSTALVLSTFDTGFLVSKDTDEDRETRCIMLERKRFRSVTSPGPNHASEISPSQS